MGYNPYIVLIRFPYSLLGTSKYSLHMIPSGWPLEILPKVLQIQGLPKSVYSKSPYKQTNELRSARFSCWYTRLSNQKQVKHHEDGLEEMRYFCQPSSRQVLENADRSSTRGPLSQMLCFPTSESLRVHVPNNWVLGQWGIVIIVLVLGKYMIMRYLDP